MKPGIPDNGAELARRIDATMLVPNYGPRQPDRRSRLWQLIAGGVLILAAAAFAFWLQPFIAAILALE
jgi:hypothetical protein